MRQRHGFGRVIGQRNADVAAQRRLDLLDDRAQVLDEAGQGQLGAENHLRVLRQAIPKEHVEAVVHKSGQRAFGVLADQLPEFGLGGGELGKLLLVILLGRDLLE